MRTTLPTFARSLVGATALLFAANTGMAAKAPPQSKAKGTPAQAKAFVDKAEAELMRERSH